MSSRPTRSDPVPTDQADQARAAQTLAADQLAEDAQYYRRTLHGLIDMGVDLAQQIHQQATTEPLAPEPAPDPTIPFDRIARAIRHTIALARKVAEPLPTPSHANTTQSRTTARRRIIREVEDAIDRVPRATAESLHEELRERLDDPDLEDDIENRPIADIITDICRDLALDAGYSLQHRPWKRRTPEDVTALATRAATPRAVPPFTRPGSDPTGRKSRAGDVKTDLRI